jgi:acetyl esterase/lipase
MEGAMRRTFAALAALGLALLARAAVAAPGDWVKDVLAIPAPAEPAAVDLPVANPRPGPAREGWAQQTPDQRLVYNVGRPVLIPVPGPRGAATGAAPAVILVPGGGFEFLSMDNEGYDVAKRLAPLGVRVFILKYRTLPIEGGFAGFQAALVQTFVKGAPAGSLQADVPYAVADTLAAVRMVRARATEWGVDPARIGLVGFSAGAITVLAATEAASGEARPDFVGMIYGPTQTAPVPAHAPPLFAAIAADDRFFGKQDLGLLHAWRQSGAPVELHLYSAGGHGFASHPTGATSDAWFEEFTLWLKDMKIVR